MNIPFHYFHYFIRTHTFKVAEKRPKPLVIGNPLYRESYITGITKAMETVCIDIIGCGKCSK